MGKPSGMKPPPSGDLEGWRQAIEDRRLKSFRLEDIAAAFQDLGSADRRVHHALTKHLSGAIMGMLYKRRVNPNRLNGGKDIRADVHDEIFAALARPKSADGKMVRIGFGLIVDYRLKSAIAKSMRNQVSPVPKHLRKNKVDDPEEKREELEEAIEEASQALRNGEPPVGEENSGGAVAREAVNAESSPTFTVDEAEDDEISPSKKTYDATLLDGVNVSDEKIDVERILNKIADYKKRLAFRLYMDLVPFKNKNGESIAKACGVSAKTAAKWITEIQAELQQDEEAKELLRMKIGAKP